MAEGTKKTVKAPPKMFYVPPDIKNLQTYANQLVAQMRGWYSWRMGEGVKSMRKKA